MWRTWIFRSCVLQINVCCRHWMTFTYFSAQVIVKDHHGPLVYTMSLIAIFRCYSNMFKNVHLITIFMHHKKTKWQHWGECKFLICDSIWCLTMGWKVSADGFLKYFSLFFFQNICFDISWKLETICVKYLSLLSRGNKKKCIINLSSAHKTTSCENTNIS